MRLYVLHVALHRHEAQHQFELIPLTPEQCHPRDFTSVRDISCALVCVKAVIMQGKLEKGNNTLICKGNFYKCVASLQTSRLLEVNLQGSCFLVRSSNKTNLHIP